MIKKYRLERGLSAERLAARCAELGAPQITAAVLANIETGRRDKATGKRKRDVTVDELLVLAFALDVPPVTLLMENSGVPLGITPEIRMYAHDLIAWFGATGMPPSPLFKGPDGAERSRLWFEATSPLRLLGKFQGATAMTAFVDTEEKGMEEVAEILNEMVERGVVPPPIPEETIKALRAHGLRYADQLITMQRRAHGES